MKKYIEVKIIMPEKVVYKDKAEFITLPAFNGEMGILPEHVNVIVQLVKGEIRIKKEGKEQVFEIEKGFAQVQPKEVKIFVQNIK